MKNVWKGAYRLNCISFSLRLRAVYGTKNVRVVSCFFQVKLVKSTLLQCKEKIKSYLFKKLILYKSSLGENCSLKIKYIMRCFMRAT